MRLTVYTLSVLMLFSSCGLFKPVKQTGESTVKPLFRVDTTHASRYFKDNDFWHYSINEGNVEFQYIKEDAVSLRNNSSGQLFYIYDFTDQKSYEMISFNKLQNPQGRPLVLMPPNKFENLRLTGEWSLSFLFKSKGVLPINWKFIKTDTFSVYGPGNQKIILPALQLYSESDMQKLWVLNDPELPVILKYGNDSIGQINYRCERIFKDQRICKKPQIKEGSKLNYRIINPSDEMYLLTFEVLKLNKDSVWFEVKGKFNGSYQYEVNTQWTFYFNKTDSLAFKPIMPLASNEPETFDSVFMILFNKQWNPGYNNFRIKAIETAGETGEQSVNCDIAPQMEFDNQAYETYDEFDKKMVNYRATLFYGDCGYWMVEPTCNYPFLLKYSNEKGLDIEFQGFAK